MSAKDKQVGGGHYKDMPIQPVEFITKNKLGFLEGCVIKRMCRWQSKDGLKDLRKAIHEIELLIEQTEEAEKRERAEREARDLERFGPRGPKGDPGNSEWPLRTCTCYRKEWSTDPTCNCAPDRPLDAQNQVPTADSRVPGYCLPEDADLPPPGVLADGTRVLCWRPRQPDSPGTRLYGWVEVGFMWAGELVRYDAEG